jgi:serine/threonine-protein phosphatase 2B regulatory subunit
MGAKLSTLAQEDIHELSSTSHFNEREIHNLYDRFKKLDRDGSGSLSPEELLSIPEFAMNPLSSLILPVLIKYSNANDGNNPSTSNTAENINYRNNSSISVSSMNNNNSIRPDSPITDELSFREFVKIMSVFHPKASREEKLRFAFTVWASNQHVNYLTKEQLTFVMRAMVGSHLNDQDLELIVEDTMKNTDKDGDGLISFEEFKSKLKNAPISDKMTINF